MSHAAFKQPFQNFVEFPVGSLVDNSVTDFDLFIALDNHFILYSGNGYRWQRDELTNLLHSGYKSLYLDQRDLNLAASYRRMAQLPLIEKSLAPAERIKNIEQVGMHFAKCLHSGEIGSACVAKAQTISEAIVACLQEDASSIKSLSGLGDYDLYTFYHSARVATYATAMAIQLGLNDHEKLVDIAVGGLMHDIGKKFIDTTILNKAGALTDEEWRQMRAHPTEGLKSVSNSLLKHVPRDIILHHHERANGSGYPDGLDKNSLLIEVQLATIADIFDALTSSRSYQQKRSRYEALDFMKHQLLGKDISKEGFKSLIGCLA